MALIYTSVEQRFNKIYFRGYKDGKRVQTSDAQHTPTLYMPTEKETGIKSLYGKNLTPIEFNSIGEAKTYIKTYKELLDVHGNGRFEYDFIHRNFKGDQSVTIDSLSVLLVDIETKVELGSFPNVMTADEEVLLISCYHMSSKKMTTFGVKQYMGSDTNYVQCLDEADLLNKWINYCIDIDFDIMSGWNVIAFDMAYLGTRIIKILGQRALNRLSPFGIVESKTETVMEREILRYQIAGRTILDMLELYKKFRFINRASYRLSYIGQVEVGDTKTENPYKTFKEHYSVGWNDSGIDKEDGFVRYNIQDVNLLVKLEEKLGLIYLAVTIAYLTKVNYSDVYSPVKMWESHILSTLLEENTFCEMKTVSRSDYSIVGGYVKDPVPGMYEWNVTVDATSLYPSIIMSLNMSPETLIDTIPSVSVDTLLSGMPAGHGDYSIAANGVRFSREKIGIMPRLTASLFAMRKAAKGEMLRLKKLYESTHEVHYKTESARYGVLQLAEKVLLNCMFGCSSSQYFLFFDNRIAEGITMTGQYIIQKVQSDASNFLGKLLKTPDHDFISYSDTDSAGLCLDLLVKKSGKKMTDSETANFILKFMDSYMGPELNRSTNEIAGVLNMFENKIFFKTEGISSRMIILAKKRNCQKVIDSEGVRYAEPEYKITGVETQRSSTPDLVREWLLDAIKLILDGCIYDDLVKYIDKRRNEFRLYSVEDIAFPRSANNLATYSDSVKIYGTGTPIAVRAALLYNNLVKKYNLEKELELIKEGNKIKYIALIEPNTLRENIIGFPYELPKQFNLHRYVDYDTQFQKAFLDPLIKIMDALNWKLEEENSLDSFF